MNRCKTTGKFMPGDVRARFESNVDRSRGSGQCHLWIGRLNGKGYGEMRVPGRATAQLSHRVAFMLHNGRWPTPCCCHRCDNRACVNPDHMFEGTKGDNNRDRTSKGRQARGESHGATKLSHALAREIRANYALCRVSKAELARRYGVSWPTIKDIVTGKRWVPDARHQFQCTHQEDT
jgi:hypothetical protein